MRPLRILLCFNPFKGTLSAVEAAAAVAQGLRASGRPIRVETLAAADGGPGTLQAVKAARGGRLRWAQVTGPYGKRLRAAWLDLGDLALIESAQAIGLPKGRPDGRAALRASSEGLGELIARAAGAGRRRIWVGLGGSASSDGGVGMASALGWGFFDAEGAPLPPGGGSLSALRRVRAPGRGRRSGLRIEGLCDVDNPLLGARGAARVFAPQKGAGAAELRRLEAGHRRLARLLGPALARRAGAGAAGGLGFGLLYFCRGRLRPGAASLLALAGLQGKLREADWLLTGEGSLDAQTLGGKLPAVLAAEARKAKRPCVAFCGRDRLGAARARRAGFSRVLTAPGRGRASARRALAAAAEAWARSLPA